MPNEFWYGWIPVLSHKLLDLGLGPGDLNRQSCGIDLMFHKKELTERQRAALEVSGHTQDAVKRWWVRESDEPLGDGREQTRHHVCILIDDEQLVRYVIIFSQKSPDETLAVAKVGHHDRTGMIRFSFVEIKVREDDIVNQVFALIRDVYHHHVYTNSDFGIMPIKAVSYRAAADLIWERFYGVRVMIENHHKLRLAIQHITSKRAWLDACRLCRAQIGELLYAEALAELNKLEDNRLAACRRARESFENMSQMLNMKQIILNDINMYILVLTAIAAAGAIYTLFPDPNISGKLISIAAGFAALIAFWLVRRFLLRSKPAVPQR